MLLKLLKGCVLVAGVTVLSTIAGDRANLEAAEAAGVCLLCTGPQCWCETFPGVFCDDAVDKTCKCNAGQE